MIATRNNTFDYPYRIELSIGMGYTKEKLTKKEKDSLKSKRLLETGWNNPRKIRRKKEIKVRWSVSRNIRNNLPIKIRRDERTTNKFSQTKGI